MKCACLLLCAALAGLACAGPAGTNQKPSTGPVMASTLDASKPDDLAGQAAKLAGSASAADQQQLAQSLTSPQFLLRLNTQDEYDRLPSRKLRLAALMDVLSTNTSPAAGETFVALAGSPDFVESESRAELLLRAAANVRPAPPAVVKFFDEQSKPDASNLHLAINAIVDNGSPPAIALLERKISSPDQEPENISGWMRDPILRHRQDVPLLEACERLLTGGAMSDELKRALIEALFDYRPQDWYPPDSDRPRPPDRKSASPQARAILQRIGQWAMQQQSLPKALRDRVARELAELK